MKGKDLEELGKNPECENTVCNGNKLSKQDIKHTDYITYVCNICKRTYRQFISK